jgi:hypothetical protein
MRVTVGVVLPAWSRITTLKTVFRIRIRIQSGQWIRNRIRKAKMTHKNLEISCFEVLDILF